VASDALRSAAKHADLLVTADRAADASRQRVFASRFTTRAGRAQRR
jgi:hypothetical protein